MRWARVSGHRGVSAGPPEGLVALVHDVVEDDEVADLLVFFGAQAVEFGCGAGSGWGDRE